MEASCQTCRDLPRVRCYCKEIEQLFCFSCLSSHLTQSGLRHVVKEIQEKKVSSCSTCKKPFDFVCICQDSKTLLCHSCILPHMTSNPTIPHSIEPNIVDSLTEEPNDLKKFIERKKIIEALVIQARKNLVTVHKFEESVKKAKENIQRALDEAVNNCFEKANRVKDSIERLISELESKKFTKGGNDDEFIKKCTLENLPLKAKDFKYLISHVQDDQVCAILSSFADLKIVKDPFKKIPTIYFVNNKSQEILFSDAASLQFNKVQFPTGLVLKELGCWCEIAAGCIFYCGGKKQAIYSAECFEIDLVDNTFRTMSSMKEPRGSPAIIKVDCFVYIFGGYQGKISLKSCEKFDIINNRWLDIGEMAYPRSGITASLLDGKIFLVGDNKSIECFDTVSEEFALLTLKLPIFCNYSISFVTGKRFIVFQKDKLLDGYIEMDEIKSVKSIPTGNWWSNFNPVLYDKKLIFSRYDEGSIWTFDTERNELKKIIKLVT